jgi:hypothetical protein
LVKELTTYIKSLLGTSWVIGTNIFAGFVPSTVDADCLIVIESGGTADFYLPDRMEKTVQILSRAEDYHDAMANAMAAYNALHGMAGAALPVLVAGEAYFVNTIAAIASPQSLGQDENGLFNISTNFVFKLQAA